MAGISLVSLLAVGAVSIGPAPAVSQSLFQPPRPDPDGEYGEGLDPFQGNGPLIAVISTGSQQIRVFDRNGVVAASKVSTGRKGYETPEGVFSIIERKVEHNSNLYDDASMPFMQRITWSGVALHEGAVPGYRASHGCIRLPSGFAERLFRTTRPATRVVIVPHDGVPLPISHPVLFQPGPPPEEANAPPEQPMMLGASQASEADAVLPTYPETQPSIQPAATSAPVPAPSAAELNSRRGLADQRLAAATGAVNEAKVDVRPRLVEQGKAERALRQATVLVNRAEGRVETLAEAVSRARSEPTETAAVAAHVEALLELAQLRGREGEAREAATEKASAAQTVVNHVKELEAERQAAQNEVRAIARKLAPVTIFVSRQTGRVYVRQSFREILNVPFAIRDPDRAVGTHVFTALDADNDTEEIKWVGLTIEGPDGASPVKEEPKPKHRKGEGRKADAPKAARDPLEAAREALDRIELPQEVLARVMPALQPGSTLIVSDLGPSVETGPGTDIVVQTKGEAQAIQSIAKFVAKKKSETAAEAGYVPRGRYRDGGWSSPRGGWDNQRRGWAGSSDWYRW